MSEHIQIQNVIPRIQYIGDGEKTTFEIPFAFFKESDIRVYLDDMISTDFSVNQDDKTSSVVFHTPPENGITITLQRNLSFERVSDFQEGGTLRANVLNDELDYQMACIQQIADEINRSMVLPPYATHTDVDMTLPFPKAGRAIVWTADGKALENSEISLNQVTTELNEKIQIAQEKAHIATNAADTATVQAQIATNKADIATQQAAEAQMAMVTKADTDMDNLTDAGKAKLTNMIMPDYTKKSSISVNTVYQKNCDGVIFGYDGSVWGNTNSIVIYDANDEVVATYQYCMENNNFNRYVPVYIYVAKDQKFQYKTATNNVANLRSCLNFAPLRGLGE